MSSLSSELEDFQKQFGNLSAAAVVESFRTLIESFRHLCLWAQKVRNAEEGADRHLAAAKACAGVVLELTETLPYHVCVKGFKMAVESIQGMKEIDDIKSVSQILLSIPLPLFHSVVEENSFSRVRQSKREEESKRDSSGPYVIKVMFKLDQKPWSNPQIIQAKTVYDLDAQIKVADWPEDCHQLRIDYVSTLAQKTYHISPFTIPHPKDDSMEFHLSGHLQFTDPLSIFSQPVVIRVRATFVAEDGKTYPVTVIGYHQLKVRVSDKERVTLLKEYPSVDERVYEIIEQIDKELPYLEATHRRDFIEALSGVSHYLGTCLQQAVYKGVYDVSEANFQNHLLKHLQARLGEEVQQETQQGDSPKHIKYRSVKIGLQVEKEIVAPHQIIKRYLRNSLQDATDEETPLRILCVLNLTQKETARVAVQNQILLETCASNERSDDSPSFPAKIAVVIIDGNLELFGFSEFNIGVQKAKVIYNIQGKQVNVEAAQRD